MMNPFETIKMDNSFISEISLQNIASSYVLKQILNQGIEFQGISIESFFYEKITLSLTNIHEILFDQQLPAPCLLLLDKQIPFIRNYIKIAFTAAFKNILPRNWSETILKPIEKFFNPFDNIPIIKTTRVQPTRYYIYLPQKESQISFKLSNFTLVKETTIFRYPRHVLGTSSQPFTSVKYFLNGDDVVHAAECDEEYKYVD